MYCTLHIYQCKQVFSFLLSFFTFNFLYHSSLHHLQGLGARQRVIQGRFCMHQFQKLVTRQRVISNRTKKKWYLNKIITRHRVIALCSCIKANIQNYNFMYFIYRVLQKYLGDKQIRQTCHSETSGTSILIDVDRKNSPN